MNDLLRKLVGEARLVMEDAMWFEGRIIGSAWYFKGGKILGNMGGGPSDLEGFLRWEKAPQFLDQLKPPMSSMSFQRACEILAKNLRKEFPDLRGKLEKGKKCRNKVVHDIVILLGNVEPNMRNAWLIARFTDLLPLEQLPSEMSKMADVFVAEMDKLKGEMAEHSQFSLRVQEVAFRKYMAMLDDMNSRQHGNAEARP